MTPSMRLSNILLKYQGDPDYGEIAPDLNEAFSLGHEFGLWRASEELDRQNEGDGTQGNIIRALKVERVKDVRTTSEDFL